MGVYTGSGPTDPVVGNKVSVTAFGVPTSDAVQALASAATSYTPTVSGTGWALGNGTITGEYTQVGKFVAFAIRLTLGSTSTAGASSLALSLPVNSTGSLYICTQSSLDSSASARYDGSCTIETSVVRPYYTPAAAGGAARTATTSVPFTWATSDTVTVSGWYFAA